MAKEPLHVAFKLAASANGIGFRVAFHPINARSNSDRAQSFSSCILNLTFLGPLFVMSPSRGLIRVFKRPSSICAQCYYRFNRSVELTQQRHISINHVRKIKIADEEWKGRAQAIEDGKAQSILERLEERGYVNQIVGNRDELNAVLTERRVGVYCGVDPTAASLHIGHMVPFMALGWMYIHGYASTFLVRKISSCGIVANRE